MEKILRDPKAILFFVGPALLIYTAILVIPTIWSTVYTFYEGSLISGFEFVGLDNYLNLFKDQDFLTSLGITLKYTVFVSAGQIIFGLGLALLFAFYIRRYSTLIRTLIFFPVVLPAVAVSQLFSKLFEIAPQLGLVNSLLSFLNLESFIQPWLGQGDTAFWVLVTMDIWKAIGFYAVILFAGLVDIPEDVLEAAKLDGAKGWRLTQFIVLPLLKPVLISSIIFSLNGTLKVFESAVALTNGGPGNSTTTLSIYMYNNAFVYNQYGYGSTVAVFLLIFSLLITLMVYKFARNEAA
ncbi:sugar ABC transporter permease [Mesobacillus foraminis]|uniref:carbohydrate ABC transporter permease n=1 Tax=Mesobacillus foraminis TaxID=279826 RepID=UPI001BE693D4|nr:sugar ABC transporter permease [Mesobacillus foraminis]MBT2759305.1 sugar ABC transporter permease [Mesobacillus foraminis]